MLFSLSFLVLSTKVSFFLLWNFSTFSLSFYVHCFVCFVNSTTRLFVLINVPETAAATDISRQWWYSFFGSAWYMLALTTLSNRSRTKKVFMRALSEMNSVCSNTVSAFNWCMMIAPEEQRGFLCERSEQLAANFAFLCIIQMLNIRTVRMCAKGGILSFQERKTSTMGAIAMTVIIETAKFIGMDHCSYIVQIEMFTLRNSHMHNMHNEGKDTKHIKAKNTYWLWEVQNWKKCSTRAQRKDKKSTNEFLFERKFSQRHKAK